MLQHPQRAQGVPAAGLAGGFHVEMRLAGMLGLQWPRAILAPFCLEDIQRILHSGVIRDAGVSEVVQRLQDIVEPAGRVRQQQKAGVDDLACPVGR